MAGVSPVPLGWGTPRASKSLGWEPAVEGGLAQPSLRAAYRKRPSASCVSQRGQLFLTRVCRVQVGDRLQTQSCWGWQTLRKAVGHVTLS